MKQATSNPLVERARRLFGDVSFRLQVAALPWRRGDDGIEIMLITSRETGRWVLPKGWLEKGEHMWEAAAREAREEAGVTGATSRNEAGRYFYAKVRNNGEEWPCEVFVYPIEVEEVASKWKERAERTRRWLPVTEAATLVNEPDLGELIAGFSGATADNTSQAAR